MSNRSPAGGQQNLYGRLSLYRRRGDNTALVTNREVRVFVGAGLAESHPSLFPCWPAGTLRWHWPEGIHRCRIPLTRDVHEQRFHQARYRGLSRPGPRRWQFPSEIDVEHPHARKPAFAASRSGFCCCSESLRETLSSFLLGSLGRAAFSIIGRWHSYPYSTIYSEAGVIERPSGCRPSPW